MKHEVITLPEHHEHYPYLWQSECGTYRIIRCCDDIQYIFQRVALTQVAASELSR